LCIADTLAPHYLTSDLLSLCCSAVQLASRMSWWRMLLVEVQCTGLAPDPWLLC